MLSEELKAASGQFFDAFASDAPSSEMLSYFSTTSLVRVQHAPAACPHPQSSRLFGLNAIRSYFDLLVTYWGRSDAQIITSPEIDAGARRVVIGASVAWMWRKSGKRWTEEFTWTLDYDEGLEIVNFTVRTTSGPGTCLMRAIDVPAPGKRGKQSTQFSVWCPPQSAS